MHKQPKKTRPRETGGKQTRQELEEEIAERKRAEQALRESEERFRRLAENAPDIIIRYEIIPQPRCAFISPGITVTSGYAPEEYYADPDLSRKLVHPDDRPLLEAVVRGAVSPGTPITLRWVRKDGTIVWAEQRSIPIYDQVGNLVAVESIARDITERKRVEEVLRESEERWQFALEGSGDGVWDWNLRTNQVLLSRRYKEMLGFTEDEFGNGPEEWVSRLHPDDLESFISAQEKHFRGETPIIVAEYRVRCKDGNYKWILDRGKIMERAEDGTPVRIVGTYTDITDHKWAEEEVKKLNRDLERRAKELDALNRAGQMMMSSTLDLDAVLGIVMAEVRDLLGAEGASVLLEEGDELVFVAAGGPDAETVVGLHIPITSGIAGWVMQAGKAELVSEARNDPRFYDRVDAATGMTTRSLMAVPLMVRGVPRGVIEAINKAETTFDEHDLALLEGIAGPAAIAIENARLFAAVDKELTERERAEAEVRKLNQDLERRAIELTALNKAGQAIVSTLDLDSVLQLVLAEVRSLLEVEASAVFLRVPAIVGEGDELLLAAFRPGTQAVIGMRLPITTGIMGSVARSGQSALINDAPSDPRDDKHFGEIVGITANSLVAVPLTFKGMVEGVIEAVNKTNGAFDQHDLEMLEVIAHSAATAIKNAQLYRHLEKALQQEQKMRAQLIQAGKLSAMGRMVASVAHEFNNPLQTIKNCLFLIQQDVAPGTQGNQFVDMAVSEVQRLSNLVAQLRAVYRPGAADQTQVVELSQVLDQVHSLVAPHLTKNQIQWEYTPPPSPLIVKGIPDQLKQVFLNLSLNASDAMQAKGGTLTVSTCVTADGRQAGIAFRDTGPGIDPRDLPNLFDPFFSTKESGTGLGLAICYDIVQKHSGRIQIESQPAQGATFTVWLPLAPQ